jgi:glycosyltransferase involved in cell wall biosynthesis
MNLLFLNTYPEWGGGETWMLDIAEGLRARGHVCILAGRPGRAWFEHTRELGWDPLKLNIRGEFAPVLCARLRGIYRREAIDVVVCNFYKEVRIAAAARWRDRRPAIINLKGLPRISDTVRHRYGYRHFIDHTVVCADFIRREYLRFPWAAPERVSVIHNCYRPGAVQALAAGRPTGEDRPTGSDLARGLREEFGIAPEERLIGTVARFTAGKGIADLISAMPSVLSDHPRARLVLLGNGREESELVRRAESCALRDRVLFAGFRHDLEPFFGAIEVFVLPSLQEGLPYVVQIAMHHGKPVIATRVGGLEEVITDGDNGILVEPHRPALLAGAISRLLADRALAGRLGCRGAATVRSCFPYEDMIDRCERLLLEVAESGHTRRSPENCIS